MHSLTSFFIAGLVLVHGVASLPPAQFDRRVIAARNPEPTVVSPVYRDLGVRQENGTEVKGSASVSAASSSESVTKVSSTEGRTRTRSLTRSRITQRSSSSAVASSSVKVTPAPAPTDTSSESPVSAPDSPLDIVPVVNVGTGPPESDNASAGSSSAGNIIVSPSPSAASSSANGPIVQGAVVPGPSPSSSASFAAPSESAVGETPNTPVASSNLGSEKKNVPLIVGGVIGGLIVAVLLIAAVIMCCRRSRRKESGEFRDLMWRRQSANLFFAAVPPPSNDMLQTPPSSHKRDPSLSTSRIPNYPFHEQYSGYGSTADAPEPVSIPQHPQQKAFVRTQPIPLYQSFTTPPPAIMTTPPSPPASHTGLTLPNGDTTRQAELKRQIADLQTKMAGELSTDSADLISINDRISFLQGQMHSPWALGQTAVVPDGVYL